jgi:hypothetical protein
MPNSRHNRLTTIKRVEDQMKHLERIDHRLAALHTVATRLVNQARP